MAAVSGHRTVLDRVTQVAAIRGIFPRHELSGAMLEMKRTGRLS